MTDPTQATPPQEHKASKLDRAAELAQDRKELGRLLVSKGKELFSGAIRKGANVAYTSIGTVAGLAVKGVVELRDLNRARVEAQKEVKQFFKDTWTDIKEKSQEKLAQYIEARGSREIQKITTDIRNAFLPRTDKAELLNSVRAFTKELKQAIQEAKGDGRISLAEIKEITEMKMEFAREIAADIKDREEALHTRDELDALKAAEEEARKRREEIEKNLASRRDAHEQRQGKMLSRVAAIGTKPEEPSPAPSVQVVLDPVES